MALLTAGLKSEFFSLLCCPLLIDRKKSRFPAARDWGDGSLAANVYWEKRGQSINPGHCFCQLLCSVFVAPATCLCCVYAWPGVLGPGVKGIWTHPSTHPHTNLYCAFTMCLVRCKVTRVEQRTRHPSGRMGGSSRLPDYAHCTCAWPSFDAHFLPF